MRHSWILCFVSTVGACRSPESGGICDRPLAEQIESTRLLEHLQALQAIADANEGTRAAGTPGYDASVAYVETALEDAGYVVTREAFEFDRFVEHAHSVLAQTEPDPAAYEHGTDYVTAQFSGAGDATAIVSAVDIELGPGNASTSGCEAEDFEGFEAGRIALVQRGACTFALKAQNAEAAGALAVLLFNQGDADDRLDAFGGTLGASNDIGIPVLNTSYGLGEALATASQPPTVHVVVDAERVTHSADNVLADTPDGDPERVVMLGAHLDSVPAGPGINDNGSGSALVLGIAERMIGCEPQQRVRFAWWGAEELGLIGSSEHVARLSDDEISTLAAYLNFDMVASPNFVHFVYDGDGSTFELETPPGSAAIEAILRENLAESGIEARDAALDGRSDYLGFMNAGIPVGGTFTGAEGSKTSEEAEAFGGESESAYDACYHSACDTIDNVSVDALEQNVAAAATAIERVATDLAALESGP